MPKDKKARIPNSLSVLFRYSTRSEKVLFSIACICACIQGVSRPAMALLFGAIIGTVGTLPADFMYEVQYVSVAMVILSGIVLIVSTIWYYLFVKVANSISQRVQTTYLASVLSKDIAWFDGCNPAEIPSRLSSDVEKVQNAIAAKAGQFMMSVSQAIAGVIIGFVKGWQIALVCCGCIPILILTRIFMAKSMKAAAAASQALYAKAGAVAEEVLFSIRTVAAFGGEERESLRYDKLLHQGRIKGVKLAVQVGLSTAMILGCMFAIYGLALYIGAVLIDQNITNPSTDAIYSGGDIYVVLSSVIMSAFALGTLSPSLQAFSEGTAALEGLYKTIEEQSEIENTKPWSASSRVGKVDSIEFKNVSFRYPTRPEVQALSSLSLTIKAGQKIALVGESGSGKSTIISLLERFYDPQLGGEILINGTDIRTMDTKSLRSLFGYVGQEPVMFATTIRANLTYGLDDVPDDSVILKTLKRANVYDFVMSLPDKLDSYCGPGGSQMSGGQKQRIAITRALLRNPQILLLDEATSALDNESEKMVQKTIDSLQASSESRQLTTIAVAHRLSTIKNSDVIFVLKRGGELVETGSHEELIALNAHYKSLVESQAGHFVSQSTRFDFPAGSPREDMSREESLVDPKPIGPRKSMTTLDIGKSEEQKEEDRIDRIAKEYKVPWKRLLRFTDKSQTWLYVIGSVGACGKGSAFPLHALLMSSIIGWYYLVDKSEMLKNVSIAALEYLALAIGVFISVFGDLWAFAHLGESFTTELRSQCFRHFLSQDLSFFDKPDNAPSKLLISLSSWAGKMHVLAGQVVGVFIEFIAALIAGLTISFIASAKLTGILIGTLPLLMLSMVVMSKVVWGTGSRKDDVSSKQAALVASEAVQNMRTVKALTAEARVLESYTVFSSQRVSEENRKATKSSLVFGLAASVVFLPYALGFYVGGLYVDNNTLTLTDMMQVLLGLMLTSMGAGQALAFLPDIKAAKAASHDIFSFLDVASKIDPLMDSGDSTKTVDIYGDGSIEFHNVCFAYPSRPEMPILRNLSFTVKAGLKVALVGPSGSGKSSIIALLLRFYDPDNGAVKLGGTDVRDFKVAKLRGLMGYVGQEPVLFDTTMENNVRYGNSNASNEDLERVKIQAKLDFVNDENVEWKTGLGPKGGLLSGGQKQRTAIARALIRDPKILLLDEATSALDSASEKVVQNAIDSATVGRTTFFIAHRLSTIQDADVILVIVKGELVERGTHAELMEKEGVYAKLYAKGVQ